MTRTVHSEMRQLCADAIIAQVRDLTYSEAVAVIYKAQPDRVRIGNQLNRDCVRDKLSPGALQALRDYHRQLIPSDVEPMPEVDNPSHLPVFAVTVTVLVPARDIEGASRCALADIGEALPGSDPVFVRAIQAG